MNRKKRLYIHCGLHKTGTTALQFFLRNNTERLRTAGVLYPNSGCLDLVGSGHHNIAWQMARDRRFNKEYGDFEALLNEIGNFSGDILLSSEDFESSLDKPGSFTALVRIANSTQRELVLIIYIRNQIFYLESLYCEMLSHGFAEEYKSLAEQVIERKMLSMKEWVFHFDYLRIARSVARIPNARVVFRSFHSLQDNTILGDFRSVLAIDPAPDDEAINLRLHERDTPAASLTLFYQNRIGRSSQPAEMEILERLCPNDFREIKTGDLLRKALVNTFRKTNKILCRKYRIPCKGLISEDPHDEIAGLPARFERLFSFETQCAIREMALKKASFDPTDNRQSAATATAEIAISAWWTNQTGE
jgi:hypothetical protein